MILMRKLNSGFLITFPLECSPPGISAGSFYGVEHGEIDRHRKEATLPAA
jgi:hypothetical protein